MEPAAVLVAALEVHVGRPAQPGPPRQDGRVRGAGVEPDVEDVLLLLELRPAALRAGESRGQEVLRLARPPGVGAVRLEQVGHAARDLRREQRGRAALAVEGGDGHAPEPLARDAPVGAGRDHVADALLAPGRVPADLGDGVERALAEAADVEADEPLLGGAEDDRVLAAPADRVGVRLLARSEQRPLLAQELDHLRVRVEHLLARRTARPRAGTVPPRPPGSRCRGRSLTPVR